MTTTDELAKVIWDFNTQQEPISKSDCILVLGSNDLRVAQRGANLFLQGYAPLIIFSGNVGRLTKGLWNKPEAEMFADVALKMGVPRNNIFIENKSTNTGENILFTNQLLKEHGLSPKSFIIVTKPHMEYRALATFKKFLPDVQGFVTAPEISFEEYPNELLSKEYVINIMVGDLQRLQIYPAKGFSAPVDIPKSVLEAYEKLVARGYTEHIIQDV